MSDDRPQSRTDRLWQALPRVLSGHGRSGALGRLVEVLGAALERLDADIDRVMRDHWVQLASGESPHDGVPSALERLGSALGIPRESWEDTALYRRRLRTTAPVLGGGLGTPRAVLALAAAALDGELCPRLARERDATTGWVLAPGAHTHCPAHPCAGSEPCPMAASRKVRLALIDNQPVQRSVHFAGVQTGEQFKVRSQSLETDWPEVEITAIAQAIEFPVLENLVTDEVMLYAGVIEPGQTLRVRPRSSLEEAAPFDSLAPVFHHPWRESHPDGDAEIVGQPVDTTGRVYFVRGDAFDVARFATSPTVGGRFTRFEADRRTPAVHPGEHSWRLRTFDLAAVQSFFDTVLQPPLSEAPVTASSGRVDVLLRWWVRPPASFTLRVPLNQAVAEAEARGERGLELLYRSVSRARGAGILADIDFYQPAREEPHEVAERPLALDARWTLGEQVEPAEQFHFTTNAALSEHHQVGEQVGFVGHFGVTRFDGSRFAP